jgi:hypothetical protein
MTNKEAVIANIGSENNIDDLLIEKCFSDYGENITIDDDYDAVYKKDIDLITIEVIKRLIAKPKSITEGGYSIQYDKQALSDLLSSLSVANGIVEIVELPKITNKSYLW